MKASTASAPPTYRLLYRGALALPDSRLLLDGLTFGARLGSPVKQNHPGPRINTNTNTGTSTGAGSSTGTTSALFTGTPHLLENPLALALESMRGRLRCASSGASRWGRCILMRVGEWRCECFLCVEVCRCWHCPSAGCSGIGIGIGGP